MAEKVVEELLGVKLSPEAVDQLRAAMQTSPEAQPKRSDELLWGVEKIWVEMVDWPKNPYRAIFEVVTSTWGGRARWWSRWESAPVEGRIAVVLAALDGKTLQQALEAPSFTWKIDGLSRSAFDQLARHRFTAIGAVGVRDNNWLDAALRVPSSLRKFEREIEEWWRATKDLYERLVREGQASWQSARAILPMGVAYRFTWSMSYRAFRDDVASRRLMFCEQSDTVFTVWAMWATLWKKFPLLAAFARPACDRARRCVYHQLYSLSAAFGCLFKPCGRWPAGERIYATFPNEAAADPDEIAAELKRTYGVDLPQPGDWDRLVREAIERDKEYFEEV